MTIDSLNHAASLETRQAPPSIPQAYVDLAAYRSGYRPGRRFTVRASWYVISLLIFESGWFPISKLKACILRLYGARIDKGLVLKPHVRIKYPWRLVVGEHCWIGEGVWIDNLDEVHLGNHVCISQGAYLCTGSHDHTRRTFNLVTWPIVVESGAWIGAKAVVLPGTTVGANAVVAAGSVICQDVAQSAIVGGQPTRLLATRLA